MARARTTTEQPNEDLLGLVRALARAAALADYQRMNGQTAGQGNDSDENSRDLRAVQFR